MFDVAFDQHSEHWEEVKGLNIQLLIQRAEFSLCILSERKVLLNLQLLCTADQNCICVCMKRAFGPHCREHTANISLVKVDMSINPQTLIDDTGSYYSCSASKTEIVDISLLWRAK